MIAQIAGCAILAPVKFHLMIDFSKNETQLSNSKN